VSSRRAAEDLIRNGRIRVNGHVVRTLGTLVDTRRDRIEVDGVVVRPATLRYLLLHKPRGVVSTARDPEGRPTVIDLVPPGARVYPVGRLDVTATGLVLLTNDGELAQRLTHPRYGIPKTYRVKVRGRPDEAHLQQLRRGVSLDGRPAAAHDVRVLARLPAKTWLEITVAEGRHHVVRRMCEAIHHPVEKLSRIRLGTLTLGGLAMGHVRALTSREVQALRACVGLAAGRESVRRCQEPSRPLRTRRRRPRARR
jgi:pseudouridine synthase